MVAGKTTGAAYINSGNVKDKKTGEEVTTRKYSTPNFLDCIERLAKGLPIHDEAPNSKYIVLSPGDMVYVPEENENISQIDWGNTKKISKRIYIKSRIFILISVVK